MGLRPTGNVQAQFRKQFEAAKRQFDQAVESLLRYLGEQCVIQARTLGNYRDITGNLRSSVGYVIVRNGQIIGANFQVTGGADKTGTAAGERLAKRLAGKYPTGWALIVVAGMSYAAKVESRGRDVLTSAEQYAQANLPRLLKRLQNRAAA